MPAGLRAFVPSPLFFFVAPIAALVFGVASAEADPTTYEEGVLFLGHAAATDHSAPRKLLVRRDDGDSFLLTVGDGCSRLAEGCRISLREEDRGEARRAFVRDPGGRRACDVLGSKAVTLVADGEAAPPEERDEARATELTSVVRALQAALSILGYEPGPVDGEVGPATASALMKYRADKRHESGGRDLKFTLFTLGMDVLVLRPRDERAFEVADTLFRLSEN